jgi:hypothetical protein
VIVGGAAAHLSARRGPGDDESSSARQSATRPVGGRATSDKDSGAKTPARIPPTVKGAARRAGGSGGKGRGRNGSAIKRGARG